MNTERLEFLIVEYVGGTLSDADRAALEAQLQNDPEARALLDEHRRLDALLKQKPTPGIRWDALAKQISSAMASLELPQAQESFRTLRMPWVGWTGKLAIAASILIAAGISITLLRHSSNLRTTPLASSTVKKNVEMASGFALVTGPRAEVAAGSGEAQVSVGPSKALAGESMLAQYNDEVISRPSHIMVASGVNPVPDVADSQMFDMQ